MLPVVEWRFQKEGAGGRDPSGALASLSPSERFRHDAFKVDKRRQEWLLGRLTAKVLLRQGLRAHAGVDLDESMIEIARAASGAPVVRLADAAPAGLPWPRGSRLPVRVSVSHSHGAALCGLSWFGHAVDPAAAPRIGVDLEWIEPRSDGFVRDFLTEPERRYWGAAEGDDRHVRANLVWSAKEAVLKVIERGLSVDTWWLTCLPSSASPGVAVAGPASSRTADLHAPGFALVPDTGEWRPFTVETDPRLPVGDLTFAGRYRAIDGFVATIAVGVPQGPGRGAL